MITKILISPVNVEEILDCIKGKPDIIDIKNPLEGSLGANFPWIIQEAKDMISNFNKNANNEHKFELSATIGDFPDLPGSASLAALGTAYCGVNFVKVGLMGVRSKEKALIVAKSIVKAVKNFNSETKVVLAGYADQYLLNTSIDPILIPEITFESGADVAMVDTAIKNGKSLFEHVTTSKLENMKDLAVSGDIQLALAGSLKFEDLEGIKKINPDIIGVRSLVCENFDRVNGKINLKAIQKLKEIVNEI